jgi:hypothetical protein
MMMDSDALLAAAVVVVAVTIFAALKNRLSYQTKVEDQVETESSKPLLIVGYFVANENLTNTDDDEDYDLNIGDYDGDGGLYDLCGSNDDGDIDSFDCHYCCSPRFYLHH